METLFGLISCILIVVLIIAAINIGHTKIYSKKQYELLKEIAIKQGIDENLIREIDDPEYESRQRLKKNYNI